MTQEDEGHDQHSQRLRRRQIVFMINSHSKISDVEGAVLEVRVIFVPLTTTGIRHYWSWRMYPMKTFWKACVSGKSKSLNPYKEPLHCNLQDHAHRREARSCFLLKRTNNHLEYKNKENSTLPNATVSNILATQQLMPRERWLQPRMHQPGLFLALAKVQAQA